MTDLLHVPTRRHNTACLIRNDPIIYIIKSNIILEALRSKRFEGEWVPAVKGHGGFFSLHRVNELGPQVDRSIQHKSQPIWNEKCILGHDLDPEPTSRDVKQEVRSIEACLVHLYTYVRDFVGAFWTGAQLHSKQAWAQKI